MPEHLLPGVFAEEFDLDVRRIKGAVRLQRDFLFTIYLRYGGNRR